MKEINQICSELKEKQYIRWDTFLINKWNDCVVAPEQITEEIRKSAYRNFNKKMRKSGVIYPQTYKKWFVADSVSIPKRWQILKLALALGLSPEETQEYLTEGISEPEIQVNDYQEFICMYCLANNMSAREYENIVACFETYVDDDIHFGKTEYTTRLKGIFAEVKTLSKEDFTTWMIKNQKLFKGYSITTYRYFVKLIDETVAIFRKEAEEMLEITLNNTDFHSVIDTSGMSKSEYRKAIKRYIKNSERRTNNRIPENVMRDINQYYVMAYSEKGRISIILSEIFDNIKTDKQIHSISAKYISELLNIALQKERLLNMTHAFRTLKRLDATAMCPEKIWKFISASPLTVAEAKKQLKRAITMQGQRVRLINRTELLILLSYIIQDRYTLWINETGAVYDMQVIKEHFTKAANSMLTVCGMRPIDEAYYVDAVLLACYGEKGIYQFTEVLEML